jgi:hypothetical protein
MTSNVTVVVACLACIRVGAAGFWFYQQQSRSGIELSVGGRSVTIETR